VSVTELLSFMVGATDTVIGPEAAPEGTVKAIAVSLQELTEIGAPFNMTSLLPCEAPKPEPEMLTGLPIEAVVAETDRMLGPGVVVVLMDTLSNVAVANAALSWLATANPMYTFWAILMVCGDPSSDQLTPSIEPFSENVLPLRITSTQYGVEALPSDWYAVLAPVVKRSVVTTLDVYSNAYALVEVELRVSRIMTPACAPELPDTLTTRATIAPSPESGRYEKLS
jgi:hypothetical protein